jgi:hypothetical protein
MIISYEDALEVLLDEYLLKGKSSFMLSKPPGHAHPRNVASLTVGSQAMVKVDGDKGFVISLGVTKDQLLLLLNNIQELLSDSDNKH